jgi:hypothetical protein
MPGLHSLEFFKANLSQSCIVVMSFWSNEETVDLAKEFGAVTLLDKANLVLTSIPALAECMRQKQSNLPI